MKHIKKYENSEENYDVNVGDTLYCINNNGVSHDLELGGKYTVDMVDKRPPFVFRLAETGSRWMRFRFSPDPNHINIVNFNVGKYNL